MKTTVLFDHDGVLVDTEPWYFRAGERALADVGLTLDRDQYLRDMHLGQGTLAALAPHVRMAVVTTSRRVDFELGRRGLVPRPRLGGRGGRGDCAVVHHDFTATRDLSRATYRIGTLAELPDLVRDTA